MVGNYDSKSITLLWLAHAALILLCWDYPGPGCNYVIGEDMRERYMVFPPRMRQSICTPCTAGSSSLGLSRGQLCTPRLDAPPQNVCNNYKSIQMFKNPNSVPVSFLAGVPATCSDRKTTASGCFLEWGNAISPTTFVVVDTIWREQARGSQTWV